MSLLQVITVTRSSLTRRTKMPLNYFHFTKKIDKMSRKAIDP